MTYAPGDTRAAFLAWLDANPLPQDTPEARTVVGGVCGCTDTLPGEYCKQLVIPHGSTYDQAARDLLRLWGTGHAAV